jgi:hypothetical protein
MTGPFEAMVDEPAAFLALWAGFTLLAFVAIRAFIGKEAPRVTRGTVAGLVASIVLVAIGTAAVVLP